MYDVADFVKPVPYNPERNNELLQCETQSLEYFRYARNQTVVAELIREHFNTTNASLDGCGAAGGASLSKRLLGTDDERN